MGYLKRKMSDNSLNAIKENCDNRLQGVVPKKRVQITISIDTYEELKSYSNKSISQTLEDAFKSVEKIKRRIELIEAQEKINPKGLKKSRIIKEFKDCV